MPLQFSFKYLYMYISYFHPYISTVCVLEKGWLKWTIIRRVRLSMINISANHITCLIPVEQLCKTQQSMMKIAHTERLHRRLWAKHPLPAATRFQVSELGKICNHYFLMEQSIFNENIVRLK